MRDSSRAVVGSSQVPRAGAPRSGIFTPPPGDLAAAQASNDAAEIRSQLIALRATLDQLRARVDHCLVIEERYQSLCERQGRLPVEPAATQEIVAGDFVLEPAFRKLHCRGRTHVFSPSEFLILTALVRANGQPVSRERLNAVAEVGGDQRRERARSLDMHIVRLRRAIERFPSRPRHILTVRFVGYRFWSGDSATFE
jgi:DNA-binding response OmpR family regulator